MTTKSNQSKRIAKKFSKILLELLSDQEYVPLKQEEIFVFLEIPKKHHKICRDTVTKLIEKKLIVIEKNRLLAPKKKERQIEQGYLHTHARGFGFVKLETVKNIPDLFIPKGHIGGAIDGDLVEVEVVPGRRTDRGPEGKILSIIKHKHEALGGIVSSYTKEDCEIVYCFLPLLGGGKQIEVEKPRKEKLHYGDRVLVTLLPCENSKDTPRGRFIKKFGSINDPKIDISSAIADFDLPRSFSDEALAEAKTFGSKVPANEVKNRLDFTKETCITIDPTTAKDFDDALSLSIGENGDFSLGVHIADVAHYVKPGSQLDKEAYERGNSTYFPGFCTPMLPESLSNELCSLKPNVQRLTMSVFMTFDKTGALKKSSVERTVIKSAKRFTYEQAKRILDGEEKSFHKQLIEQMVELCLLLKKKRIERGSVDLAIPEIYVEIDDDGAPIQMKKSEYDITHQLVEEFMLKANEVVATRLAEKGALIYRVHEEPGDDDLSGFCDYVRKLGFSLPPKPDIRDIQKVFETAQDHPAAYQIATKYIRTMKMACYSPENVGHFGLSLSHYTHFTSPIRRYSDLIIQRLLFESSPEDFSLDQIADHVSERERISMRAEGHVKLLKKFRLLEKCAKENPHRTYRAAIVGIKPMGIIFELDDLYIEGFFHVSELEEDYFLYNEKNEMLQGERTGKRYRLGDWISVTLTDIDLVLLKASWTLLPTKKRKKKR